MSVSTESPFVIIDQVDFFQPEVLDEKLREGCKKGFYFLEAPRDCKPLIQKAVNFGYTFFNDPTYTNLRIDPISGYTQREQYQVESLILEEKYWQAHFPKKIAELSDKMCKIGLRLLEKTLDVLDVPKEEWSKATGGATDEPCKAANYFSFHHYREEKECEGMQAHRDFGLITVLYLTKPGLEVFIDGVVHPVEPLQNYFLINYGEALADFVDRPKDFTAAWHRVGQVKDRTTFGVFINHNQEAPVYKSVDGSQVLSAATSNEYMAKKFSVYEEPPEVMKNQAMAKMQEIEGRKASNA